MTGTATSKLPVLELKTQFTFTSVLFNVQNNIYKYIYTIIQKPISCSFTSLQQLQCGMCPLASLSLSAGIQAMNVSSSVTTFEWPQKQMTIEWWWVSKQVVMVNSLWVNILYVHIYMYVRTCTCIKLYCIFGVGSSNFMCKRQPSVHNASMYVVLMTQEGIHILTRGCSFHWGMGTQALQESLRFAIIPAHAG